MKSQQDLRRVYIKDPLQHKCIVMATAQTPANKKLQDDQPGVLKAAFLMVVWFVMHAVFNSIHLTIETTSNLAKMLLEKAMVPVDNKFSRMGRDLARFQKTVESLAKVPKHIAFSLIPEKYGSNLKQMKITQVGSEHVKLIDDPNHEQSNVNMESSCGVDSDVLSSLAKEISWAYAANINVISLYDHQGLLQNVHSQLKKRILDHIQLNITSLTLKGEKQNLLIPQIQLFNVNDNCKSVQKVETNQPQLCIFLFSHDNGKVGVVDTIKDIMEESRCKQILNKIEEPKYNHNNNVVNPAENNKINIENEKEMDTLLNEFLYKVQKGQKIPSEPEVLVVHGDVTSTLGFMPWQIRLTEFFWLPALKTLALDDFTNVLIKYGKCQQKLGK